MKDATNIFVISLSNIGDVILTLPVVGVLREKFPEAKVSILVGVRGYEAIKDNPEFSEIIIYDKHKGLREKISLIKQLRSKHYDLVIDLRHSLFPLFLGVRYHNPIFLKEINSREHQVKKHLRGLKKLGIKVDKIRFPFYISKVAKENIEKKLGRYVNRELIVINPTAASHLKCWEDGRFVLLAQKIKHLSDYSIVVVGGKEDKEKCARISEAIEGCINLSGELNIQELAALLKRTKIFITNDSGPLHLASALDVPTLAIFGPTDPLKYGPLGKPNRVVRKDLPCSPCELAQCPGGEHQCMNLVSVDNVFLAFKEILNEEQEKNPPEDSIGAH